MSVKYSENFLYIFLIVPSFNDHFIIIIIILAKRDPVKKWQLRTSIIILYHSEHMFMTQ